MEFTSAPNLPLLRQTQPNHFASVAAIKMQLTAKR